MWVGILIHKDIERESRLNVMYARRYLLEISTRNQCVYVINVFMYIIYLCKKKMCTVKCISIRGGYKRNRGARVLIL